MKFHVRTIGFKIWKYFSLFSAAVMLLLWLMLTVFLSNFYEGMKKKTVAKVSSELKEAYGSDKFEEIIDRLAFENMTLIIVADENGSLRYASDEHGFAGFREKDPNNEADKNGESESQTSDATDGAKDFREMSRPLPMDFRELCERLKAGTNKTVSYTIQREMIPGKTLIYGTWLEDDILYISTPLDPINSTVAIIRTQLFYIMILALFISSFIALFLSRKLSKPIENITDTAAELAKGNYEINFENGYYEEIDNLAHTLNHATKELSKVEGLRRELIANISHDFRTPLTMIKAYAELIRDISGDNKGKRDVHLSIIIEESDRLSLLVNDILQLSVIQQTEADDLSLLNMISLSALLMRVLNRFKLLQDQRDYFIEAEIAPDIYVIADELRLEQVFYNLIGNGINYMGVDKKIIVRLIDLDTIVRFEVTDHGDGISDEDIPLIWERYYKSKNHKRSVISTGIGLSIVKGILESYEADYGVITKETKGSTFWFEMKKEIP